MLAGLYPVFLDAGYSPDLFWELSVGEVLDCLESYNRQLERQNQLREVGIKEQATLLYNQAQQIANMISIMFDKHVQIVPLTDYYPELFTAKAEHGMSETELQLQRYKADMENYAYMHNLKWNQQMQEGGV